MFDEIGHLKLYLITEKVIDWNTNNILTEDQWLELFCFMREKCISVTYLENLSELVSCLAGTCALIKNFFLYINKYWTL